ncbi:hypothetical protein BSPWISOXPB_161 [uncultured Gammaproteobacteria bacterium]|nr:hypothetical protein BSPWISOXPB_161 [uncultured Gammaproteobacteria bacterium]
MLGARLGVVGILAREDVKVLTVYVDLSVICVDCVDCIICIISLFALSELTAYLHWLGGLSQQWWWFCWC